MSQPKRILVGTVGEGVFRSDDDGETFTRKSIGMFVECDVRALLAHPECSGHLFAGTNEGLYRTMDFGESWERLESPMDRMVIWSLMVDRTRPDTIFAGTRPADLFRSNDGGRSWTKLGVRFERDCKGLIFNRVTVLVQDPIDRDMIFVGVEIGGVQVSRDGGESWTPVNDGLSSLDIHGLAVIAGNGLGRRLVATTNNDINLSDVTEKWLPRRMTGKFSRPYFRGVFQKSDEPQVLLIGNGDGPPGSTGTIWRSRDGGESWLEARLAADANSTVWGFAGATGDSARIYSYSVSGELYRSVDAGLTWVKLNREFGEIRSLCIV